MRALHNAGGKANRMHRCVTRHQERRRIVAYSSQMSWPRSRASERHPRIRIVNQLVPGKCQTCTVRKVCSYDVHRSNDGRDCEGLWVRTLSLMIVYEGSRLHTPRSFG